MHRTFCVPRLVGFASLLAVLTLIALPGAANAQQPMLPVTYAQDPPKIEQQAPTMTIAVGTTQIYSSKNNLDKVDNPNPKVVLVSAIPKVLNQVRLEAIAPGRTTITFTDVKGNKEVVDVIVISDRVKELRELIARAVPTASVNVTSTDSGNTIILTGTVLTEPDLRAIQQLAAAVGGGVINNVRMGGVQQVQLEVVVALVNRSESRNMAFSWNLNGPNWYLSSLIGGPGAFASAIATAPAASSGSFANNAGSANVPFGVLNNNGSFMGFLQALRVEGLAKVYAEPRVTTLSGRPGYIQSGGETPIILPTGVGAPPSVTYKPFGTIVNFLPVVLGNGKIHLEVRPEVSEIDSTAVDPLGIAGVRAPSFKTRSAQVTVQIDDGQTLAIGGLIQNTVNSTIQRVPILGDLPYVGVAFTSKSYAEQEQELIILVTPRLVDPIDCTKFPKYLPGRETRAPDDFELFLEGILEAPRNGRAVTFHPHTYKPAFHGAPNYGQYPCGDNCFGGRHGAGCANGNCATPNGSTGSTRTVYTPSNAPAPSFPEPYSNRVTIEAEPVTIPMAPMRQTQPGLGPVAPTPPLPPAREFETRPSLPPVTPGGYYPR